MVNAINLGCQSIRSNQKNVAFGNHDKKLTVAQIKEKSREFTDNVAEPAVVVAGMAGAGVIAAKKLNPKVSEFATKSLKGVVSKLAEKLVDIGDKMAVKKAAKALKKEKPNFARLLKPHVPTVAERELTETAMKAGKAARVGAKKEQLNKVISGTTGLAIGATGAAIAGDNADKIKAGIDYLEGASNDNSSSAA
jgi:hypothetical protein